MSATVGDIYTWMDQFAPYEKCEEWDNPGILAGSADQTVSRVLCALELNEWVLKEAVDAGAQLILTHHPILFRARRNLREDDPEGRLLCGLIRARISLIASHTNLDAADLGVNDALALRLKMQDIEKYASGMRVGRIPEMTLKDFTGFVSRQLGTPVRRYGPPDIVIQRVAVMGGAGGDYGREARLHGADVFVTGEISHHKAWDLYAEGLCSLEAGHAATEQPVISLLKSALQIESDRVQWGLEIIESRFGYFLECPEKIEEDS